MMRSKNYYGLSVREPAVVLESKPLRTDEEFESRRTTLEKIMVALHDEKVSMVGIFGVGGVGKTTMVIRVGEKAKAEKLFDLIVMVVVGKRPNLKKIQSNIARFLDLRLGDHRLDERASLLRAKLQEINRVLIMLDDVQETLNLEEVGVPFGDEHKGCKIIVTSRLSEVCTAMGTLDIYGVEPLIDEEGWILFTKMASYSVDFPDLLQIAKSVAKECKGLPLALVIVGKALKSKNKRYWKYALLQLRRPAPAQIPVVLSNIYRPLELGYNLLGNNAARFLFLFCSLLPEHYKISLEYLVGCGMGVNLFTGIENFEEARYRVCSWVQRLKDRCLLLERETIYDELVNLHDEFVEMHDVVRDVASLVAPKQLNYLLGETEINSSGTSTGHEYFKMRDALRNMLQGLTLKFDSKRELPNLDTLTVQMLLLHGDPGIVLQMITGMKPIGESLGQSSHSKLINIWKLKPVRHGRMSWRGHVVDESVSKKPCVSKKKILQSIPCPNFDEEEEIKQNEESEDLLRSYLERRNKDYVLDGERILVPEGGCNVDLFSTCNQEVNSESEQLPSSNSSSFSSIAAPEQSTMVETLDTVIAETFAKRSFARILVGDVATSFSFPKTESEGGIKAQTSLNRNLEVLKDVLLRDQKYVDFICYCSVFPRDFEFTRDMLVWSWIAMGFIKAGKNGRMEEVGFQCFDNLLKLEYFLPSGHDQFSDQTRYKLGDSMNFCHQTIFHRQQFRRGLDSELTDMLEFEHMSLFFLGTDQMNIENLQKCRDLHTLLLLCCRGSQVKHLSRDLFLELKVIRIMDLSHSDIVELPSSVGNMKSLRYLDMSETPIRRLPESIDHLTNLQTLRLVGCPSLNRLPRRLNQLINLRHLVLDTSLHLKLMPAGIGKLTNLQTLRMFVVGKANGYCIGELKHMNNLSGSLCILNLDSISNKEEAMEAALYNKQYLKKLELQWSDPRDAKAPMVEKEILDCLQPHFALEELKLLSYGGVVFPSWVSCPSFGNIVSFTIHRCRYCTSLPSFGELPSLEYLYVIEMNGIRHIDSLFCRTRGNLWCRAFPKLKRLTLDTMLNLENWSGIESGDFPSLVQLTVKYCQKLNSLPLMSHMDSLEYLEISYCEELLYLSEKLLPASLKTLMVKGCPELKERCFKDGGEEWSKVSRVPLIYVDHERIQ
ncbi:hypothetical protein ACH5RR_006919 [Cinchona calisaya]|uniref:NB-ARC domain-containing protein n=1 Tax=Cinchona calisaya TaxID=153742 RepID=A0ABD3AQF3_9GENT